MTNRAPTESGPGTAPPLSPAQLRQASEATLRHYDREAESFRAGTADHDVTQNIDALLRHIAGTPPFTILDVGCGPGRDLAAFMLRGHRAIGLDGAPRFVEMARASGCEVWQQDFLALELPPARFDGVFCNASLFHVPRQALPRVLRQLHATLAPGGVLFCSNPRGHDDEGWYGGRYGVRLGLASWRALFGAAGFDELEHYYRPPGMPRDLQPWLAMVWRRADARVHDASACR